MNIDAIRATAAAWLLSCAGLSAHPAGPTRPRYIELVAPGERPERAAEIAAESGCALVLGRGYLRTLLERVPVALAGRYRDQRALADLRDAALEAGAVRPPWHEPKIADIVHLGAGAGAGAGEHVYAVTSTTALPEEYGGIGVDSVDGGQPAGGYQAIRARQRVIVPVGVDGAEDQLVDGSTRPVLEVYDLEALVNFYGWALR